MRNVFIWSMVVVSALGLSGCSIFSDYPIKVECQAALWPGNVPTAVGLVMDDGCESQIVNAIPLLSKYRIPATFYPIPDALWVAAHRDFWEKEFPKLPMVHMGSQTYGYYGAANSSAAHDEIARGDRWVRDVMGLKRQLISYASPSRVKWPLDKEAEKSWCQGRAILVRNDGLLLVPGKEKLNTVEILAKLNSSADSLVTIRFFGIDGDWFSFPINEFEKLLQELAKMREQGEILIAPMVELDKYAELRNALEVGSAEQVDDEEILIELSWKRTFNSVLFDIPVELAVRLPDGWRGVEMSVDEKSGGRFEARGGIALCKVYPGDQKITLMRY